ncbi:carboxylesterase family protein [Purpureocillium lavendulum]|uniref:Carboxylesterase family protein n=1 Tax=Purpureocillium lavendulum TaxID=1247861 RepID=A0AB34G4X0_9HYPO|nr:carboxylesterase family protein [Purpureocillium lavendulum]
MSTAAVARPQTASFSSGKPLIRSAPKKTMSITQTYYLAHKARAKLSREAAQPDHDLRLLVGHANLLDSLMLELADAEREQERWFNQSVRGSSTDKAAARHVQWADSIAEQPEEEYDSDSSDSDSDSDFDYEEDVEMTTAIATKTPIVTSRPVAAYEDEEEMGDDLEEDYTQLELVRTPSHSNSPPELLADHDSEEESDEESMPPSPADASLPYTEKEAKEQGSLYDEEYYVSRRTPAGLVSAISVY